MWGLSNQFSNTFFPLKFHYSTMDAPPPSPESINSTDCLTLNDLRFIFCGCEGKLMEPQEEMHKRKQGFGCDFFICRTEFNCLQHKVHSFRRKFQAMEFFLGVVAIAIMSIVVVMNK
ncbi:unnamed protein product [Lactuca virosa]|uniref:Uncharacterized protein n=1 Tax=Lactuca virosa TaxID=75947 RepID=A0AAU9N2V0_9ASTR|nr:unnamed protein product [Lactuca virosa]